MRIINPWVLLFSLLAVVGCGDGGTGSGDASTEDAFGFDASQDGGGETDAGGESDAGGCTAGEPGCACAPDGSCNGGDCVDGLCVACPVASSGCACRTNGTCDTGLRCNAVSTRCEACPAGDEGCACAAGDSCGLGLFCMSGMCVLEICAAGSDGCPCRSASPACDGAAYCDGSGLCQTCSSDVVGCPCDGIACTGGLTCDTGRCRTPLTCASLRTAGTCAEHQACVDSPGADGMCMPGVCDAGYRWVSATSTCVACVSPGCSAEPTCAPGLPNSLACAAENRVCGTTDGVGSCGACLEGFLDVGGVCQPDVRCGSSTCTAAQYCDESMPSAPVCRARCAGANDAFDTRDTCIRCASCAGVPGSTGRVWARTNSSDECLCETEPGYFIDPGGTATPVSCDADGDGWVRQEAIQIVDRTPVDPALLANMRCTIRTVQRFVLADEYGTESTIESCDTGLLQDRTTGTCTPRPVRLYEIRRNDVDDDPALATAAPAYAAGGRVLRANERNSMTKLCVSVNADVDGDGSTTTPPEDLRQVQPMTAALNEAGRIRAFSHFGELYRMIFVPPVAPAVDGTLRIEERSRCDAAFPLAYDSARTDYNDTMPAPESYWRNCERRRTPSFNRGAPGPDSDFGQWSCSATTGSCPATAAPANPMYAAMPPAPERNAAGVLITTDRVLVRDHGLCELNDLATRSRVFRGMNHPSQFQCVEVVADSATPQAHQRRRGAFAATGTLVANACQVPAGSPSRTLSDGSVEPAITCAASTALPAVGSVVWAAVKYQPYGDPDSGGTRTGTYAGGCVNETAEWPALCPSTLFGLCSSASQSAFGRYCCFGCDNPRLPAGSPGSYVGCSYAHGLGSCNPQPVSATNPTGAATCSLATCDSSWGNCNGVRTTPGSGGADGCETNISTTPAFCGDQTTDPLGLACDAVGPVDGLNDCRVDMNVPNTPAATRTCVGGVCTVGGSMPAWSCNPNWGNCDNLATETPPDGCEMTLVAATGSSSIPNCGGCGVACNPPNAATWSCPATSTTSTSGVCTINSCQGADASTGAYRNLNGLVSDGCECRDDLSPTSVAGAVSNTTSYAPPSTGGAAEVALRAVQGVLNTYLLPEDSRATGTANYGATVTGTIPYNGTWSDWWQFNFVSGGTTAIELVTAAGGAGASTLTPVSDTTSDFVFDVYTSVGARSTNFADSVPYQVSPAAGSPTCARSGYTRFSWRDNFSIGNTSRSACVGTVTYATGSNCAAPTTGWVRVRRRVPTSTSCTPYYLRIRKLLATNPYS